MELERGASDFFTGLRPGHSDGSSSPLPSPPSIRQEERAFVSCVCLGLRTVFPSHSGDRFHVDVARGRVTGGQVAPLARTIIARPRKPLPSGRFRAPWKRGEPRDSEIRSRIFWEVFDDEHPERAGIGRRHQQPGRAHAAFERVEEARAVARVSRADLFPGVSFDPSAIPHTLFAEPPGLAGFDRIGIYRQ